MTSTEETPRHGIRPPYAGVGLAVLAMVTTLVGVFTFGFLSGIPIVIAWAAISRARRVGNSIAIRVSWAALGDRCRVLLLVLAIHPVGQVGGGGFEPP
jgi:hypothetical protein